MPLIIVTNPKIGIDLIEDLQEEPAYQNIQAFSATHAFLRHVLYICRDREYASISAKKIKEWFSGYHVGYKPCLDALVKHDLIEINRHYIVGLKPRRYKLTEKGARLMCEGQMQYLKKTFADKELKRKLQKQQSYRRSKSEKGDHPLLDYINNGLMNYTFSEDAVKLIEDSDWGYHTKLKAMMNLTDFAERDFVKLKYNEADGRCWNEFVGMKRELRKYFSLGKLHYRYTIDIRSCHPLFLGHYLVHCAVDRSVSLATPVNPVPIWGVAMDKLTAEKKKTEREQAIAMATTSTTAGKQQSIPIITPITHPPASTTISNNSTTSTSATKLILHYDGCNSDIQAELIRWNELFCDPDNDPKEVLTRELGYTREQAKAALNQTINGGKQYRKFIKWFEKKFPRLFAIWDRTYKAIVGVGISFHYETALMQDMGLYELADELGLHLTYEFDGCGVMCRDDDTEVLGKLQQLIEHIQALSERLWGIRPVIVVKTAMGDTVVMPNQMERHRSGTTDVVGATVTQPASIPATRPVASAFRRSSGRSGRPARKPRGSPHPSGT